MTIQFPVYTFHFLYSSCGCSSKGLPASEELPVSVSTTSKVIDFGSGMTKLIAGVGGPVVNYYFFWGAQREGNGGHICGKNPKIALISD